MSSPRGNNAITTSVEEKIRQRAYQLFEKRGRQHGRALDDWIQAEAETLHSKVGDQPIHAVPFKKNRTSPITRRNSN
jgi:hypothetical protein